ncbi:MAG: DUF1476 domain-containing protein [Alphaproteobacteria bacterium]
MSNGFKDREKSYEAKYAHDEETNFKIMARRNKLLGLWAAEQLGLAGPEAEAYARAVVVADFEETGDEDVYRKVHADFEAKKVDISEHRLRRQMAELLDTARQQVTSET